MGANGGRRGVEIGGQNRRIGGRKCCELYSGAGDCTGQRNGRRANWKAIGGPKCGHEMPTVRAPLSQGGTGNPMREPI
jgi:hypothetical protein